MIADYSDLMVEVGELVGPDVEFAHRFPRAVAMAENKLNRLLKVAGMETVVTLTTNNAGEVALPADYLEMRLLKAPNGVPLTGVALQALEPVYGAYFAGSGPYSYAVSGNTLYVAPKGSYALAATYYTKLPSLETNGTNWLLQASPQIYALAVALEVAQWAVASGKATEDGRIGRLEAALGNQVSELRSSDFMARFGNATVRLNEVTP